MTRKQRRTTIIVAGVTTLAVAVLLVITALQDHVVFFQTPSEVVSSQVEVGRRIRVGGLVEVDTLHKGSGETVTFSVTDMASVVPVTYTGILPDLFREGQGVVVEGALNSDGWLVADTVFAKHDENYMPPEAAEALKRSGHWKDGQTEAVSGQEQR
ncbi:MAG: cytochrome c maturation protein CcmE [Alphaproteobacteria bacterium]|nr:MAG: cytochrome c maturation protein CcmE [Alphaproteobacteria bacterium]